MGVVSAGPVRGTRGSGIVFSAADVQWMSVIHVNIVLLLYVDSLCN